MTTQHPHHHESPYSREATLDEAEERVEPTLPEPAHSTMSEEPLAQYRIHPAARFFRRGPWEGLATIVIAAGVIMLMQPLAISLYTYSFVTVLAGTAMFVIVSHFPD